MKLKQVQKILLSMIAILVSGSILLNVMRIQSPFQELADDGTHFFSLVKYSLLDKSFLSIADAAQTLSALYIVQEENDILKQQIDELAALQTLIVELQSENNQLKELNELEQLNSEFDYTNATVISRSYDTYANTIIINVGSQDGIELNEAVVTTDGLIGKIVSVNESTSSVRLLTTQDENNKVSVKIAISETEMADAILEKYDADKQMYLITLLSANTTITPNMIVMTSGMGGVFPSGLLVGVVDEVEEVANALTMKIYVKPSASYSNLNYVTVVSRGEQND
ncbi:MAG: rod shape-determining protein MreC [Erysipelotrichaceae bacterium]